MIAAIMCGGKATRMQAGREKPLLEVGNAAMIERVVSALLGSGKFAKIVAVVSPNTPQTKGFLESRGIEVIETAGEILSPSLAGAIYDSTGTYDLALAMYITTFTASATLFALATRMRRPNPEEASQTWADEAAPASGT